MAGEHRRAARLEHALPKRWIVRDFHHVQTQREDRRGVAARKAARQRLVALDVEVTDDGVTVTHHGSSDQLIEQGQYTNQLFGIVSNTEGKTSKDPRGLSIEGLAAGPDGLQADSGRIRQLLHNLIRNAADARDDATLRIATRVEANAGSGRLTLELADDGPGFPPTVLETPFEPYVTNKARGSGLGLAICRKIVTEHDGRITIGNRASGGARVVIELPLSADAAAG